MNAAAKLERDVLKTTQYNAKRVMSSDHFPIENLNYTYKI